MNARMIAVQKATRNPILIKTLVDRVVREQPKTSRVEAKIAILSLIADGALRINDHWKVYKPILK